MPVLDAQALLEERVTAIRRFHQRVRNDRAELDLSGGLDSAVMLGLLARALGPEKIVTVFTGIHSSTSARERAREVADAFEVPLVEIDISEQFDQLIAIMRAALVRAGWSESEIAARIQQEPAVLGSIRSCLRAPIGRGFNRLTGGGIRHGTGNECEDRWLRFYQKGGDGEVDTNPIAMLSKGETYQLAKALGVPRSIIAATPSPDLHGVGDEQHTDEDEIRALSGVEWTYSRIDVETGEYTHVGTIEILTRFLDTHPELFAADELPEHELQRLADAAQPLFGRSPAQVLGFLESARALERMTRHKANPHIPTLGQRSQLVAQGILTNALPQPT